MSYIQDNAACNAQDYTYLDLTDDWPTAWPVYYPCETHYHYDDKQIIEKLDKIILLLEELLKKK